MSPEKTSRETLRFDRSRLWLLDSRETKFTVPQGNSQTMINFEKQAEIPATTSGHL